MVIRVRIRRAGSPRPGFFSLTAEPRLREDGPLRGHLDYVIFTAKMTGGGLQAWHAHKNGNLIADFSALVPHESAVAMVKDLYLGRTVVVPGRHRAGLLKGRFEFGVKEQAG